ncbi:hypothetical protein KIN20_017305 [Parelaphostrongylus tenuis]|uniref:Uncharacterized protein n=1 Tax=Parelaphostrongylus tenuis TaxID=148309 RepID=A0AAD5N2F1_PARTN|nr:hypothetical protein KIN20_017305 [Parelaphostrongylus tenuis]
MEVFLTNPVRRHRSSPAFHSNEVVEKILLEELPIFMNAIFFLNVAFGMKPAFIISQTNGKRFCVKKSKSSRKAIWSRPPLAITSSYHESQFLKAFRAPLSRLVIFAGKSPPQ